MNDQDGSNFERISAAVDREFARQARSKKIILALLILALIVAIVVIKFGKDELGVLESNITADEQFTGAVADAVVAEPVLAETVARSESVKQLIAEQTATLVASDDFAATLVASESVRSQIADSSSVAVAAMRNTVQQELQQNRQQILELSRRLSLLGGSQTHLERIERIEQRTARMAASMSAPAPTANIDELQATIQALRAEVAANQSTIADLQTALVKQSTGNTRRSYLLRENTLNTLADVGFSVRLGARSDGQVAAVEISGTPGRPPLLSVERVRLGEPFEFIGYDGGRYRGTLSYSQARFLARDYIGMELEEISQASDQDQ